MRDFGELSKKLKAIKATGKYQRYGFSEVKEELEEAIAFLAKNHSAKQVAEVLNIGLPTVYRYSGNIVFFCEYPQKSKRKHFSKIAIESSEDSQVFAIFCRAVGGVNATSVQD